jgi:hypothetical protein
MADQSLEAFQLGASLYDRAQTQRRMMEQLNIQTAESVLQRRGMELQNKARDFELTRALKNSEDEVNDVDNMNYNVQTVDTFFVDPNAPFPTFKPVKAAKNQAILNQYRQQLDDFSTHRRLMNGANETKQIVGNQLADAISFANKNGLHDVVWQNNNGLNEYGQIDMGKAKLILDSVAPKMAEKTSQESGLSIAAKISSAASSGPEAIDQMVSSNLLTPAQGEMAKSAAASKQASKSPLTAALADWQRAADDQKDAKFQVLKAAAAKSGQDIIVGPSGEFEFKKALPQAVQTQLFNGIKSANSALSLIDSVNPKDIDAAFSISGGLREFGQAVGGAKIGIGLNPSQTRLNRTIGALTPLVARGLLSETGRLTDADARRAKDLIDQSFLKSSPAQVKQALSEIRTLFLDAKDRMKSPFGIIGEMDIQKIEGQPRTAAPQKPKRVKQGGKIYELDETTNAYIEVAQ